MIRQLFHFLCALSLLLCLVTMVIWVRSYWIREDVSHQSATRLTSFACSRGELLVATGSGVVVPRGVFRWAFPANDLGDNFSRAAGTGYVLGFGFGRETDGSRTETDVIFPLWFLTLLLILPLLVAWRDHRKRLGRCAKCGYDLRASRDRCPECGTPIPTKATV